MITNTGINKIASYISSLVTSGRYMVNGVSKDVPIYKTTLVGSVLTIYLYFEDNVSGTLTNFKLIDKDGAIFADKADNISKPNTKNLLVAFKFTVQEVL